MANFIRRQDDTGEQSEDMRWFHQVNDLMRQFDVINKTVQEAARSNNTGFMMTTFNSVLVDLPKMARKLQDIKPKGEQEQDGCAIFLEGLHSYIQACECYKKSLIENSEEHYARAGIFMNDAGQLLKEALTLLRQFSRH